MNWMGDIKLVVATLGKKIRVRDRTLGVNAYSSVDLPFSRMLRASWSPTVTRAN